MCETKGIVFASQRHSFGLQLVRAALTTEHLRGLLLLDEKSPENPKYKPRSCAASCSLCEDRC